MDTVGCAAYHDQCSGVYMAGSYRLDIKQSQKLVMTQSLRQSIEMLQLSTLEMAQKISEELLNNPTLEEDYQTIETPESDEGDILSRSLTGDDYLSERHDELEDRFGDTSDSGMSSDFEFDRKRQYIENAVSQDESLVEHLLWQAKLTARDEKDYLLYEGIITSLDENGLLAAPLEDIARDFKVSPEMLMEKTAVIQLFDPIGCAVTSIRESLLVQCRHFYPHDLVLYRIIDEHFTDLEKLNYDVIAKKLDIPLQDVLEHSREVQNLNPFPGRSYSRKEVKYIIPDVEVRQVDGEVVITMNDDWVPRIKINSYYMSLLKKKNIEKNQREYIQDKIQAARHFIKNISSRRETIMKVVKAIVERQGDFLVSGPGNLKYLTHLDIARELGIHESTVSRVTTGKYVQTMWGVFELKYFFVSKLKSGQQQQAGEEHSSDQVKSEIVKLVAEESPDNPFSDEEIVEILRKKGVDIARRTVAKYRGMLDIPSSGKRKKINMIKTQESITL